MHHQVLLIVPLMATWTLVVRVKAELVRVLLDGSERVVVAELCTREIEAVSLVVALGHEFPKDVAVAHRSGTMGKNSLTWTAEHLAPDFADVNVLTCEIIA